MSKRTLTAPWLVSLLVVLWSLPALAQRWVRQQQWQRPLAYPWAFLRRRLARTMLRAEPDKK